MSILQLNATELGISQERLDELRDAFMMFDQDGDGKISDEELRKVLEKCKKPPTDEELEEIIRAVDSDGDRTIDFREFVEMMKKHNREEDQENELRQAFQAFDSDKDGYISVSELKIAMENLGEKVTDSEAAEMIQEADTNGDLKIDINEFMNMMMKDKK